jgi:hypothetical protein
VLAFLVHARNLLGFYWPPPRKDQREGDVFAYDYVPGLEIAEPNNEQSLSDLKRAISARVAHICLLRAERLQWVANVIRVPLSLGRAEFLVDLTEPYRTEFAKHGITYNQSYRPGFGRADHSTGPPPPELSVRRHDRRGLLPVSALPSPRVDYPPSTL